MLTWIGIGSIIAIVIIGIIYSCVTIVKQGYYVFVTRFGGKIINVLPPGWYWTLPYPISHKEEVKIERMTTNIEEVVVTCNVPPLEAATTEPAKLGAIAEFKSKQVSLNFVVSFQKDPAKKFIFNDEARKRVEIYVRYLTSAEQQKEKLAKLIEEVTDIIQAKFREKAMDMNYTDVMRFPQKSVEEIRAETQKDCDDKNIPIDIVFLKLNNPFIPADPKLAEALDNITKESFMQRTAQIEFDKLKKIAERERDIAVIKANGDAEAMKTRAKGQAESIRTIAQALGAEKLPDKEKAAFLLSKEALDTYAKMFANPGAKFVISGNIMDEIKSMLTKFTRGAP
ncbi:hypothetical protein HZB94_02475 [Candidatus Falkowbacteria bacterium]|nr:hypothetical protein [Candidatus Falkowbacteria bacterium]